MTITPDNGFFLRKDFSLDVPLNSEYNKIEIWLTTPLMQSKISVFTKTMEVSLKTSNSFIIEISPIFGFFWLGLLSLIKIRVKDFNGNVLLEE